MHALTLSLFLVFPLLQSIQNYSVLRFLSCSTISASTVLMMTLIASMATTVPYVSSLSTMSTLASRPHLLNGSQMGKLLGYVKELNNYSNTRRDIMIPFEIGGEIVGYISPAFCEQLFSYTNVFHILNFSDGKPNKLQFTSRIEQSLSSSVMCDDFNQVNEDLRRKGVIRGWRDELLPVTASFSGAPKLLIERAACPYYGLKAYGVHVNGFVRDAASGRVDRLWVARRAATKSTWPGMLDHIAAGVSVQCNHHRDYLGSPIESNNSSGGQPYGIGVMDNVVKECKEEAGIDEELARRAQACGAVSYNVIDENNHLKRDALFCFDLELPKDFVPVPVDGEVESFQLQPLEWVLERVIEGGENGYKPNCNLVLMDFFIRLVTV